MPSSGLYSLLPAQDQVQGEFKSEMTSKFTVKIEQQSEKDRDVFSEFGMTVVSMKETVVSEEQERAS